MIGEVKLEYQLYTPKAVYISHYFDLDIILIVLITVF